MAETETFSPELRPILLRSFPEEVPRARRAIRNNLLAYPTAVVDTVEQCASETVTNAIVHSDTAEKSGFIMLVIVELQDRIRIEVIDDGSEKNSPQPNKDAELSDMDGRGLFMVDTLTDAWGTHVDEDGRNVWFEVNIY
ncbi:ATP-binding protein [Spirillospora sp. NBC_00431]